MTTDTMEDFARIVRETLGTPELAVTRETVAADVPGWDSVAMVDMILAAEEHFGIQLGSQDMDRITSVGDMVDVIEAKTRGQPQA